VALLPARVSAGLCDRDCAHTPWMHTAHTSTAFPFSPSPLQPFRSCADCLAWICRWGKSKSVRLCVALPVRDLVTGTGSICGCSVAIAPFTLHSRCHPRHNVVDTNRSIPLHLPTRFGVALLPTATHSLRELEPIDVTSFGWPCQPLDALLAHRNTSTTIATELTMLFSA